MFWCTWIGFGGSHRRYTSLAYAEQAVAEKSEAAFRFNCAQRELLCLRVYLRQFTRHPLGAHSNTLEIIPYVITMSVFHLNWERRVFSLTHSFFGIAGD
jgi:hypothetical protein